MKRLLIFIIALSSARAASAQSIDDRGYITLAADFAVAGTSFTDTVHPVDFGEPATVTTNYQVGFAPGFTIGGGARVWRHMTVGVEVGRVSKGQNADVSAQVPHPFFFNQPRSVSGTASLDRAELGVHVVVAWVAPLSDKWRLAIGGGPSWISVDQDVVTDVTVTQTYPYDTATFAGVVTQKASKGHAGFNVGIDATYLLARHAGLAAGLRYSHASVPLTATATTDAGGAHVTAGLRLRF
jgi:hypothetical protein